MEITFLIPTQQASPYCWLMKIGSMKLGVHKDNGWCMQFDSQLVFFDSEDKCMPLMPLLEIESKKIFDFLKIVEISASNYSEVVRRFPKELLIKYVFHTSCSGYWPEKALAWLVEDDALQPLFKDELIEFINNKVMPQGARQKAKKLIRTLQQA